MKRRDLILRMGSLVVLLPAARVISACGTSGTSNNATNFFAFTSSVTSSHSHIVQIEVTSFQSPPSGGVSKDTSVVVNPATGVAHQHTVSLTESDLASVQGGGTVTKETSTADGHTHLFSFRTAGQTASPNPTPAPY